jgi:hypothetical protein
MWHFPIFKLTVAAGLDALSVLLLQTFSVAVSTPAPQAAGRLLAVDTDATRALAIVTLSEKICILICIYF